MAVSSVTHAGGSRNRKPVLRTGVRASREGSLRIPCQGKGQFCPEPPRPPSTSSRTRWRAGVCGPHGDQVDPGRQGQLARLVRRIDRAKGLARVPTRPVGRPAIARTRAEARPQLLLHRNQIYQSWARPGQGPDPGPAQALHQLRGKARSSWASARTSNSTPAPRDRHPRRQARDRAGDRRRGKALIRRVAWAALGQQRARHMCNFRP